MEKHGEKWKQNNWDNYFHLYQLYARIDLHFSIIILLSENWILGNWLAKIDFSKKIVSILGFILIVKILH